MKHVKLTFFISNSFALVGNNNFIRSCTIPYIVDQVGLTFLLCL